MGIITIITILTILSLLCAWLYSQKFVRKIRFYNHICLTQIITSIVPTTLFLLFFITSYIDIISNSILAKSLFLDGFFLTLLFLFSAFALLGVGIHFAGKCLSEGLNKHNQKEIKKSAYFFHMILGHHIIFVLGMLSLLLLAIFNLYRPFLSQTSPLQLILISSFGFLWAISWAVTIIYAQINRLIYIIQGLASCILIFLIFSLSNIKIYNLPYSVFFFTTLFFTTLFVSLIYLIEKINGKYIGLILFKKN